MSEFTRNYYLITLCPFNYGLKRLIFRDVGRQNFEEKNSLPFWVTSELSRSGKLLVMVSRLFVEKHWANNADDSPKMTEMCLVVVMRYVETRGSFTVQHSLLSSTYLSVSIWQEIATMEKFWFSFNGKWRKAEDIPEKWPGSDRKTSENCLLYRNFIGETRARRERACYVRPENFKKQNKMFKLTKSLTW